MIMATWKGHIADMFLLNAQDKLLLRETIKTNPNPIQGKHTIVLSIDFEQ